MPYRQYSFLNIDIQLQIDIKMEHFTMPYMEQEISYLPAILYQNKDNYEGKLFGTPCITEFTPKIVEVSANTPSKVFLNLIIAFQEYIDFLQKIRNELEDHMIFCNTYKCDDVDIIGVIEKLLEADKKRKTKFLVDVVYLAPLQQYMGAVYGFGVETITICDSYDEMKENLLASFREYIDLLQTIRNRVNRHVRIFTKKALRQTELNKIEMMGGEVIIPEKYNACGSSEEFKRIISLL